MLPGARPDRLVQRPPLVLRIAGVRSVETGTWAPGGNGRPVELDTHRVPANDPHRPVGNPRIRLDRGLVESTILEPELEVSVGSSRRRELSDQVSDRGGDDQG